MNYSISTRDNEYSSKIYKYLPVILALGLFMIFAVTLWIKRVCTTEKIINFVLKVKFGTHDREAIKEIKETSKTLSELESIFAHTKKIYNLVEEVPKETWKRDVPEEYEKLLEENDLILDRMKTLCKALLKYPHIANKHDLLNIQRIIGESIITSCSKLFNVALHRTRLQNFDNTRAEFKDLISKLKQKIK